MKIGIDGSRAFLKQRTGIEEYSYQVIRNLADKLNEHQVVLYVSTNYEFGTNVRITNIEEDIKNDLSLPKNWSVKIIRCPRLWTQIGLSLEMLFHPVNVLFVPAHTVPIIHPKKTIVTIHGLEYEIMPQAYSWWERFYMRLSIKNSCRWASKIISVSQNTKKDLVRLYGVSSDKIRVVYEGYDDNFKFKILNLKSNLNDKISNFQTNSNLKNSKLEIDSKFKIQNSKFLLFIGRLEERKNIVGIIKAFEILKERYGISHKLILAGRFGYGAEKIRAELEKNNCAQDIILPGFVSEQEKWELLQKSDVFLFPTFYEGFGIPILEAQSVGVPVVASIEASMPEVAGDSAVLVDPKNAEEIADETYKLLSDKNLRDDLIRKGYENIKRFSWEKCAQEIAEVLTKK